MVTQVFTTKANEEISIPAFSENGRVFVTFVPHGEELLVESEAYIHDQVVYTSHSTEESKHFLDSLKNSHEDTIQEKIH